MTLGSSTFLSCQHLRSWSVLELERALSFSSLGLGISKLDKGRQRDLIPCLREMLILPPPGTLGKHEGGGQEENFRENVKCVLFLCLCFMNETFHSSETEVSCLLEDSIPGICGWRGKYIED